MGGPTDRAARILDRAHRQTATVDADGNIRVMTTQDVEPHLKYAADCRRADWEHRGQFGKRGEMRRTMSVPTNVMLIVAQKLGIPQGKIFEKENMKRITAELKGREFSLFRTCTDKRI